MTSVNTNASATTALRTLQQTSKALDITQNRISTGLKIGEAKDNAAYWAISTTLKSDNKSLATVKDALNLGAATVDTAYQGLNKAREVLDEIKSKLTSATQDGLDRNVIQDEIDALQDQLKSIASSSIFSGENWLSVDSSISGYNASKEIVASFARDSNNAVTIGTVTVDTSTLKLFDSSSTATGIIDGAKALKDADGNLLSVGGTDAAGTAPSRQSLEATTATAGLVTAAAGAATNSFGTIDRSNLKANDRITFNLALNGNVAVPVTVQVTNAATAANADLITAINLGITNAGITGVTASVNGSGEFVLTSAATGSGASIVVSGVAALDGDGAVIVQSTATAGLLGSTLTTAGSATQSRISFVPTAAANTPDANDYLEFDFLYGSETYRGRLTGPQSTVPATFATALDTAVRAAVNVNTGTAFSAATASAADVTITVDPNTPANVLVQTVGKGADKLVSFQNINSYAVSGTTPGVGTVGTANAAGFLYNVGLIAGTAGTSTAAVVTSGAYAAGSTTLAQGDRITFSATLSTAGGGTNAPIAISVNTTGVTNLATFQTAVQSALDVGLGAGKVIVGQNGGATALTFTTVNAGENVAFAISGVLAVDGDGATAATAGLTAATATGTAATTAAAAYTQTNSAFTGTVTYDDQDTVTFDVAVDGGTATTVTINKAIITASGVSTTGVIATAAEYATVLNTALTEAGVTGLTATAQTGNFIRLSKTATGTGSVAVTNAVTSTGADTISVDTIDISDTALTTAGVSTAAQRKSVISAYISVVNDAINSITTAAAKLGSVASRIDLQSSFVDTLIDTIEEGVGNLVDADLSEESTRLQALQTKQQLGIQALSIANSSTQNVLALFQ